MISAMVFICVNVKPKSKRSNTFYLNEIRLLLLLLRYCKAGEIMQSETGIEKGQLKERQMHLFSIWLILG